MTQMLFKDPQQHIFACQNIMLVSSGKGGVGKTWFSITCANALARRGKKVLLFDGDLGMANVDIQMNLMPEKDLGDYIRDHTDLSEVVTHYKKGGFDIIAGNPGSASLASLPISRVEALQDDIKHISGNYDKVIIDLGAGVGGTVKQLSQLASSCLVIITDEPTSLTDAYAFIKYTRQHMPHMDLQIVVNQAVTKRQGLKTFETIKTVAENFIKYSPKLAGIVPKDSKVPDSIRHQDAIFNRYPDSKAAKVVREIADKIR